MAEILLSFGVPCDGLEDLEWLRNHHMTMPITGQSFSEADMLRLLPEADILLACGIVSTSMIEAAKHLRLIVCYGAGYNNIDLVSAAQYGITVCSIPDSVTEGTAELTFSLILSLCRRVTQTDRLIRCTDLNQVFGIGRHMGMSLRGNTLGIVGMGRIGQRVADFGRFFGMKVIYTAHHPKPVCDQQGDRFVTLEELAAESDVISLNCPLTDETRHMIDSKILNLMKPSSFLINTARGDVVCEADLIQALKTGKIAGAALDVFPEEPMINPELIQLQNVILTSHIGSNSVETRKDMILAATETMRRYLAGEKLDNIIVGS